MSKDKALATVDTTHGTLAELKAGALALSQGPDEFGLSAADIQIATLLLMQPASDMVAQEKAKLGDIVHNESEKVLGGLNKPVEVICLYKFETLRVYAAADGKFMKEFPYSPGQRFDKEGIEPTETGDIIVRRYHTMNFFVLLTEDVRQGEAFPVLLRFKSSSLRAGSKFASMLMKKKLFNKLPFDFTGIFNVEKRQNEKKQNWCAFTFSEGRATTPEEKEVAKAMVSVINAKKYSVLETHDVETEGSSDPVKAAKPVVLGSDEGEY